MSKITELASGAITAADSVAIELVETVVIVRWPNKPTVLRPRRLPDSASIVVRLFAEAHITLARIRSGKHL